MIEIKNLHKKFGNLSVLDGLDLEIRKSGVFAVLGPNGSGKTTLIKCLLGMVIPDQGDITVDGSSILKKHDYRNNVNYLSQIANFPPNLTVRELIKMVKDLRPKQSSEQELIELFHLESFLRKRLGHLSGGTKQKVNLVLTFMFDSDIIILDEPMTGLDPVSSVLLKELIQKEKSRGKTVIITSHIISFVEQVADEIVFLLDGQIYFKGSIDTLKEETKNDDLESAITNLVSRQYA